MTGCKDDDAFNFERWVYDDRETKRLSELAKKDIEKSCFVSFNQNHGGNKMAGTESEWDKVTEKLWENGEDFYMETPKSNAESDWDKATERLFGEILHRGSDESILNDKKASEGLTTASSDLIDEIICDMTHLSAKMELLIDLVNYK